MSTKPTELAEWCIDGTFADEPLADYKADGWPVESVAVSSYFNWLGKLNYEWQSYLNDGDFQGPASFNDTVQVQGVLQCLDNIKHGDMTKTFSFVDATLLSGTVTRDAAGGIASTASCSYIKQLEFKAGDRLKSLVVSRIGNASADATVYVYVTNSSGVATDIVASGGTITNPGASWSTVTIDLTDTTLNTGDSVSVQIDVNATGLAFGTSRINYDRP